MLNNIASMLGVGGGVATDYESIQTYTLGSSTANVTFSSIPTTYSHLQLRLIARSDRASAVDGITLQVGNGSADTAANYSNHQLLGDGANPYAYGYANESKMMQGFQITGGSATSGIFAAVVIDILDYANTNKYKTSRGLGGNDRNGAGEIDFNSGSWRSTSAINTIKLYSTNGANLVQYTSIALYGIK